MSNPRATLGPGAFSRDASAAASSSRSVADQLMQLDSAITATLQEIDANFARAHQVVTAKLLPAVKSYGQHSARTWQSARFWQDFFITAAHIPGKRDTGDGAPAAELDTETNDASTCNPSGDTETYASPDATARSALTGNEHSARLGSFGDDDDDDDYGDSDNSARFFKSVKHVRASSPPRLSIASRHAVGRHAGPKDGVEQGAEPAEDSEASWANVESPFERLKREIQADRDASIRGGDHPPPSGALRRDTIAEGDLELRIPHMNAKKAAAAPQSAMRSPAKLRGGPSASKLLNKVLNAQQRKADAGADANAQTRRDPVQEKLPTRRGSELRNMGSIADKSGRGQWDGIVDLRNTPLRPKKVRDKGTVARSATQNQGKGKEKPWANIDSDDDDSLAWPPGMSPPVTMQFSVPQSRYAKTPAKEAAKLLVDDLLRTAEAGPSTARKAKARGKVASHSGGRAAIGSKSDAVDLARKPTVTRDGRVAGEGTPASPHRSKPGLKMRSGPQKRRDSMPTPPTLTRHIGAGKSRGAGTPRASNTAQLVPGSRDGSVGRNTAATIGGGAAKLLDEGEGGRTDSDEGEDEQADDDDMRQQKALTARQQVVSGLTSRTDLDTLLDGHTDEEDSDSESESEDEEDDADGPLGSARRQGSNPAVPDSVSRLTSFSSTSHTGWTATSNTRVFGGASLDNDTLFGVGKSMTSRTSGPSSTAGVSETEPVRMSGITSGHSAAGPHSLAAGDDARREFRVVGQLEDTVQGGKLLEDRDLTYSAPSPTPWKK
ncbi:unnamed protein product [Parajaminaea phylloscopi]